MTTNNKPGMAGESCPEKREAPGGSYTATGLGNNSVSSIDYSSELQRVARQDADRASRALVVATARLNDSIHDHVVRLASRNGSITAPAVRYVHFSNASARAIGLPKSDATVIAALPTAEQAMLALLRRGLAARIPHWAVEVEAEGGTKPHNRILTLAKAWAELEVKALRACGIDAVIAQAEALLALEDSE